MLIFEIVVLILICIQLVIMTNNRQNKADNKDNHTYIQKTRLLMIVVQFLALGITVLSIPNNYIKIGYISVSMIVNVIGILIMIIGLFIRIISMKTLGKYYSTLLFVNSGQKLLTNGIYGLVRHPIYLGDLLLYCGIGISISNYLAFFIILITCIYAYIIRINQEEEMMKKSFGDEYIEYSKKVKKLFPFIY